MTEPVAVPKTVGGQIDELAKRLKLWASAMVLVGAVVAGMVTSVVAWLTKDVRAEVAGLRASVAEMVAEEVRQRELDERRWDRTLVIVELSVAALVEPEGSPEQVLAVRELRRLRRVTGR